MFVLEFQEFLRREDEIQQSSYFLFDVKCHSILSDRKTTYMICREYWRSTRHGFGEILCELSQIQLRRYFILHVDCPALLSNRYLTDVDCRADCRSARKWV